MEQRATLYERDGRIFVGSDSRTTAGFWIGTAPLLTCDAGTPALEVAEMVLEALSSSRSGLPVPPRTANPAAPLLKAAGVRYFGTFMKGAKALVVSRDHGTITVVPMRNAGSNVGFLTDDESSASVPDADVEALATAITTARGLAS